MDEDTIKLGLAVVLVFCIVGGLAWVLSYRHTQTVTLDGRAWVYDVSVKYDVETTSIVCESDSKGVSKCDTHTDTTTYTRCSARNVGYELPIIKPVPTCNRYWGDYERESVSYVVKWHNDNGGDGQSYFSQNDWVNLPNGRTVKLTTNLFNQITTIEAK